MWLEVCIFYWVCGELNVAVAVRCHLCPLWDALPTIVVLCGQGSGKSSVLESIRNFLPKGPAAPILGKGLQQEGHWASDLSKPEFESFVHERKDMVQFGDPLPMADPTLSFHRLNEQLSGKICCQIALTIRDEVEDLEKEGINMIPTEMFF
ncbi:hypothetical protein K7X08_019025 [Anisodus acutangulus]|uniref:Uncharacterized protein n=1 Tax=Anisodus acutangulus TaxID=402998 RepID=A0A9Q1M096_9SOLA|nr:hypothetical protein K7X08_019025 [Anisodus acutangulus]